MAKTMIKNEFIKLPLEERCTHKLWKARLHGYTEAAKIFQEEEDEKAPVFSQFVGLVSKFVGDTNAAAQEKGLEAVLLFVQNAAVAGKTVKDVMSVIVQKCIAAPNAKTKDLAVQIALMYVEIEKQEQVVEELVKGLEHKNPKIVAGCCSALTLSLKEFGSKVVAIKPMLKMIGTLLEDRDKIVREETKAMVVEMFRWTKDSIKPQLSSLKPIQLTELETEFNKVRSEKPVPSRYLRSQQLQQARSAAEKDENGGDAQDGGAENEAEVNVDPYDFMDPINVLSQIPGDFYEKIEAKKWQERKEAVESLEKILEYPKYEKGDYADLVRALMKIIAKDSNVIVVGISVKCMGRLAEGLKKGFQPYANTILPQLLEKFKEKKANVVTPLREAVDAIYPITTLEAIQKDVVASLENKNPAVKAETAAFLARCFTKATPTVLNKKLLKVLTVALLKTLDEPDPTIRDNSAEALGTAMKVVGERVISPFMPDLDQLKMDKIKEFCEKAVVVKVAAPPAPKAAPQAEKKEPSKPPTAPSTTSTTSKGPAPKKVLSTGAVKKAGAVDVQSTISNGSAEMDIIEKFKNYKYLLSEKPPQILEVACSDVYVNKESFKDGLKAADVIDSDRVLISKLTTSGYGYFTFCVGIISKNYFESREKLDEIYSFEWRHSIASFTGRKGIFLEKVQFQELLKDVFQIKIKTNLDYYLSNRDEMRRDLGRDISEGVTFKKIKEEIFFKLSLKIFGNEDDNEEAAKSAVILRDFRVLFDDGTEVYATARRGAHYLIMYSMRC